jgi:hypothetical protein
MSQSNFCARQVAQLRARLKSESLFGGLSLHFVQTNSISLHIGRFRANRDVRPMSIVVPRAVAPGSLYAVRRKTEAGQFLPFASSVGRTFECRLRP